MSTVNVFGGSVVSGAVGNIGFMTVAPLDGSGAVALTAANVLGGYLALTVSGGADITVTLPTAVILAAAINSPLLIGSTVEFTLQNNAVGSAITGAVVTVAAGITAAAGMSAQQLTVEGALVGGAAASGSGSGTFVLRCTSNTEGAETFTLYRKS